MPSPRYYRKIFKIRGIDSPNVRLAMMEKRKGLKPSGTIIVPGMLEYGEYMHRRATWDKIRQTVGLDAEFYAGADVLLFAPQWLDHSHELFFTHLKNRMLRRGKSMGVDPAEGGDKSTWTVINEYGIVEQVEKHTPNTTDCVSFTVVMKRKHAIRDQFICFDRGGGGKQHADRLHEMGIMVRTMGFGEKVDPDPQYEKLNMKEKVERKAEKYTFKNRRAQIYWELSDAIDPSNDRGGFAIDPQLTTLRKELSPFPRLYDGEGRIYLPPKKYPEHRATGGKKREKSLQELIGHSPDNADSLALAWYALTHPVVAPEVRLQ